MNITMKFHENTTIQFILVLGTWKLVAGKSCT